MNPFLTSKLVHEIPLSTLSERHSKQSFHELEKFRLKLLSDTQGFLTHKPRAMTIKEILRALENHPKVVLWD
jgi:hypothetical protein